MNASKTVAVVVMTISVAILSGIGGVEIGKRVMTPRIIKAQDEIMKLESRLVVQGRALETIIKAGVVIKQIETVFGGTSLARAGVPVDSLAITVDDGRIFVFYGLSYTPNGPFPLVAVYRWKTDNSPRELLEKLAN